MKKAYYLPIFIVLCILLQTTSIFAEKFEFKYTTGHTYDILSIVNQEVFVNDVKSHDAVITNEIEVEEVEAQADGSARIDTIWNTSEIARFVNNRGEHTTSQSYFSSLSRDKFGRYILDENAYMPVVRNIPLFPDRDLQPGDSWTAQGEEVHDFRNNFGIEKPFRIPFVANYMYKGTEIVDGKVFHIITASYDLIYESPAPEDTTENIPILTMVNSAQTLYWDTEKGYLDHYTEDYRIIMETTRGDRIEFVGDAHAEILNFDTRKIDETLASVQEKIDNLDLENVSAHVAPKGITISLENIQFEADSAVLQPDAIAKLRQIASILETLPDNDIVVTGHTALAGTARGRQQLSKERAQSVADFLIDLGVRRRREVETVGMGADDPIAPNDSDANRARNRRVEITVLND